MTNRKILYSKKIKAVIFAASMFFALRLHGESASDNFAPDITNPFHDVFSLYFSNDKSAAVKLLKKEFSSKRLKNKAYINYGLIQEYENNFPEAEKYYRMALADNERLSILYLNNLYNNYNKDKVLPLLLAVQKNEENCWTLYEQAALHAKAADKDKAFDYLSAAIDMGFSSVDLLNNDPAFDAIKDTFKFSRLKYKAEKNYSRSKSITQIMKYAEYEYENDKPFGTAGELKAASNFEKAGKDKKALGILKSLINSNLSFRDKNIALFWSARLSAKTGEEKDAKKYLNDFIAHISGQEKDKTGYKEIINAVYKDLILNDEYLKKLSN
ncbi:MAG: hypothetical protein V1874_07335 [Spirochaetota bacterium]